jgi:hypothetical protein
MSIFSMAKLGALTCVFISLTAALQAQPWRPVEIVAFRDFDDLEVRIDGRTRPAFLVGLRPLRDTIPDMKAQQRATAAVAARCNNAELFAKVVTTKDDRLGLSLDSFSTTKKTGFDHRWDPATYPYCKTGWGAYNFNLYFLHAQTASYHDNFGDNAHWREFFSGVVEELKNAPRR